MAKNETETNIRNTYKELKLKRWYYVRKKEGYIRNTYKELKHVNNGSEISAEEKY